MDDQKPNERRTRNSQECHRPRARARAGFAGGAPGSRLLRILGFPSLLRRGRGVSAHLATSAKQCPALAGLAFVARRTGQWQESLTYFQKLLLIAPRDGDLQGEYGTTLELLRRYPEADRQLKLALAIAPTDANAKDHLLTTRLFGFGDFEGARKAYQSPPEWRLGADQFTGDVMFLINLHVYPDVFDRRFAKRCAPGIPLLRIRRLRG